MADLSHINGKAAADISHFNGKALGDITHINNLAVVTGSSVTVKFGSSTNYIDNSTSRINAYKEVIISGWQSGDQLTINVDTEANFWNYIDDIDIYYSINSTYSWTLLKSYNSSGSGSASIPGVDYGETLRIRIDIQGSGFGASGDAAVTLTGGSFTGGSGTVTAGSPDEFFLMLSEF